ncbi:MAG: 1-deoxy-D-xylulose-5-phosphate synthase [Acidimicrobiales bacterium]|nr:1-deoxy-D-xylulose-5-phosphate synthase [Acidimicrobiales bacterium]
MTILETIQSPADIKSLDSDELTQLAEEIRNFIVRAVSNTGGHLGSNLGVVELTIALHRVFNSPHDPILWDTGHQAYVHKLLTGRALGFAELRQEGGMSGYPNRGESEHDWVENSHASTILSYAQGLSVAFDNAGTGLSSSVLPKDPRRVVAVIGDGALTGGMSYEALNNLGHSGAPVIIVLNDNGRSYAPTVSKLSLSISNLRVNSSYVLVRERLRKALRDLPLMGNVAYSGVHSLTSALRELIEPHVFFEALGVRYIGPLDGHDIPQVEQALEHARSWHGPIVVHVLTHKGKGYAPAEDDDLQRLHDVKAVVGQGGPVPTPLKGIGDAPVTYTDAFAAALVEAAEKRPNLVAITAAMPGPTGLLHFQARYPDRFFDVGIAEQHAVTFAAGMAMGGLKPVVAVYSTFFSRAFDQANLDVGLHKLPIVFALDRAGITGDDGASHHGVLDLVLGLSIPDVAIFAPSSAQEIPVMFESALSWDGPAIVRYPKTPAPSSDEVGSSMNARKVVDGDGSVAILAVGKMVQNAKEAVAILEKEGFKPTLWDVRVVRPLDHEMLKDAIKHDVIVTIEDGYRIGGAGMYIADSIRALSETTGQDDVITKEEASESSGHSHSGTTKNITVLGIPTIYIPQAKPDAILARFGLDGLGIAQSVKTSLQVQFKSE